jgi:hypothetical protein
MGLQPVRELVGGAAGRALGLWLGLGLGLGAAGRASPLVYSYSLLRISGKLPRASETKVLSDHRSLL